MSCAKVLHKHIYKKGEIFMKSLLVWLGSHEGGSPTDLLSLKAELGAEFTNWPEPMPEKQARSRHQWILLCQVNFLFSEWS